MAQPAAGPRARRRARRRRGVRGGRLPLARVAGRRGHRHPRRRPVGSRRRSPGRCSRCSTPPSTSPGRRPWPATSATPTPARRPTSGSAVGSRSRGAWPDCSRRTPGSGRGWWPTGRRGETPTAPGAPIATDLAWQPELWRRLVARVDAPSPVERHLETVHQPRRGPRGVRPADPALAVRPHPAVGDRDRAARRPGPGARGPRVAAAPVPCGLGGAARAASAPYPGPTTTATGSSATRSWPGSAATPASSSAPSPPPTSPPTPPRPSRRCRTRCSAGCRPTSRPTGRGPTGGSSTRPTVRCRCTRATGSPGRSTSCARCCSGCWPTTPPSSRATSW